VRRLLVGYDIAVAGWVAERVGCRGFPYPQAIGQLEDGKLIAGVVWDSWNGASMQIHVASETGADWLDRVFLRESFRYPFEMCRAAKLIALVNSYNERSIQLVTKLGFVREATLREAHPDGDLLVYTMTKSQCRWLERRNDGQGFSTASRLRSPGASTG
jgi:hypothetical protein